MHRRSAALGLFLFVLVALAACSTASADQPGPAATPGPNDIVIAADGMQFVERAVAARAGTAFSIRFENREGVPHNVSLRAPDGTSVAKGEIFGGPGMRVLAVRALAPGAYTFTCDLHPDMTGTLSAS